MLGHKLSLKLSKHHRVFSTVRQKTPDFFIKYGNPNLEIIEGVDAFDIKGIENAVQKTKPDYVLNCIGIVKQLAESNYAIPSIQINALLPHQLEKMADKYEFRLVHFSTDCVFSGKKGPYHQTDLSDVNDLYGMTKFLGEVKGSRALTIRSSIVGREFVKPTGLIEWFLSQKGKAVKGYKNALYSGLTTNAMADLLLFLIEKHPDLSGLYHVSSAAISKYDLLVLVNDIAKNQAVIEADTQFCCDRRLAMNEFHNDTGWASDNWETMIKTMFEEDAQYYITTA